MEKYCLKSKLSGRHREYLIQTTNDIEDVKVSTTISVDGKMTETITTEPEADLGADEVLSLVKSVHGDAKGTMEILLSAYHQVAQETDVRALTDLGITLYHKRLVHEAADLLRTAVRLDQENHQALVYLGHAEAALGHGNAAVKAASAAVALQPSFADYHNCLGLAHMASRNHELAISAFREAVRINMYYADGYFNLGLAMVIVALTRPEGSVSNDHVTSMLHQFDRAVIVRPDYETEQYRLGTDALRAMDLKRAYHLLQTVQDEMVELKRRRAAAYHVSQALCKYGEHEEALGVRITSLRQEVADNPSYVDRNIELAACLINQANASWSEAIDQLRAALDKNPSLSAVRRNLDHAEHAYQEIEAVVRRVTQKD